MIPTLAWLDFSAAERERTMRVLALFRERETRDELGLGGIRDSFSDHLFPGTSTIQTRLRYMFFVPWIYQQLERQRVTSRDVSEKARKLEVALTEPLLDEDDHAGVFGRVARGQLKRLPSSVYWAGLRQYGICQYPGSREDYHRDFDVIHARRDRLRQASEGSTDLHQVTWHPKLPSPPEDFLEHPSFRLTREEALFFKDCLMSRCSGSLLTYLAWQPKLAEATYPWEHPYYSSFSEEHRRILEHARLFANLMYGAAILYNLLLAEARSNDEWRAGYSDTFGEWLQSIELDRSKYHNWNLAEFWGAAQHPNHTIARAARDFVTSWHSLFLDEGQDLAGSAKAQQLIRDRERRLKGPRSRFQNRRALDQWGGASGLVPMAFRWPNTQTFLRDLQEGLVSQ